MDTKDMEMFFFEKKDLAGLFNLGRGKAETWKTVAESMFKALEKEAHIEYIDMPEELKPRYQYFTEADMHTLNEAGYTKKFTSIENSIKDYICNYLDTDNPYY